VHCGHLFAAVRPRVVKGKTHHAFGRPSGDDADGLRGLPRNDVVFDARIETLGVLPNDNQVDVLIPRGNARDRLGRPEVRVEIQRLADRHIHAPKAFADRCGDGAFDAHTVSADRFQHLFGQRRAVLRNRLFAGLLDVPIDGNTGGLDDTAHRLHHFRANAVAGDQCDRIAHVFLLVERGVQVKGWVTPPPTPDQASQACCRTRFSSPPASRASTCRAESS